MSNSKQNKAGKQQQNATLKSSRQSKTLCFFLFYSLYCWRHVVDSQKCDHKKNKGQWVSGRGERERMKTKIKLGARRKNECENGCERHSSASGEETLSRDNSVFSFSGVLRLFRVSKLSYSRLRFITFLALHSTLSRNNWCYSEINTNLKNTLGDKRASERVGKPLDARHHGTIVLELWRNEK